MKDSVKYAKYEGVGSSIRKDGHTMMTEDVVKELNRKSELEEFITRSHIDANDAKPVLDVASQKYKTKPIDYTGCDSVIAEHLKRGEAILCDTDVVIGGEYVRGYNRDDDYPYDLGSGCARCSATPIEQTQYVKKASEIVKWLEDNGYKCFSAGDWHNGTETVFYSVMFFNCGKPVNDQGQGSKFLLEWLEYK